MEERLDLDAMLVGIPKIPRRRLASRRMLADKAQYQSCLNPDVCGDGWNHYDCLVCAAKAIGRARPRRQQVLEGNHRLN